MSTKKPNLEKIAQEHWDGNCHPCEKQGRQVKGKYCTFDVKDGEGGNVMTFFGYFCKEHELNMRVINDSFNHIVRILHNQEEIIEKVKQLELNQKTLLTGKSPIFDVLNDKIENHLDAHKRHG